MNDMRTWINLVENEGQWYSNEELETLFKSEDQRGQGASETQWINQLVGIHPSKLLYTAQHIFQKWARPELRPIWISDMRSPDKVIDLATYRLWYESVMWKVESGPEDPDE